MIHGGPPAAAGSEPEAASGRQEATLPVPGDPGVPVYPPVAWVVAPARVPRSWDLLGWPMRVVLVLAMVIALVVVLLGVFTTAFEARAEAGATAPVRPARTDSGWLVR
ncbi:hypothetical protein AB0B89_04885 [Sphaerisporangium sp. NPDC049002]|uniref:hypothetical protein n=1 Tax=unclassified Sphaerisporangium TaxID=2630420 RepID=UPI0033C2CDDB